MEITLFILACLTLSASVFTLIVSLKNRTIGTDHGKEWDKQNEKIEKALSATRQEMAAQLQSALASFSASFAENQKLIFQQQDKRLEEVSRALSETLEAFRKTLDSSVKSIDLRMAEMSAQQEKNAQALRTTVDAKLTELRQGNEKSLGEIKASVDEKLQTTLEERISRSFREVSTRLAEVYKGLGEMQTLASGVGDLKRVLSNVKTRGILGEIQLGAILEEILSPEQYETNVATVPNSANRVEFAVKLPGQNAGEFVYLPIDSKFPSDAYLALQDAYESGDPEAVKAQSAELAGRIKAFAKDIQTKYISAPHTTDFAIMFLPTEGLYAEVVKMGMVEVLQRSYKINIAGPTTMAALLNSLQTGFRTLAIQKRSGEVWEILGAVKTEFDKFESALKDAQARLEQASRGLDNLVGVRTRQIQRKLKSVSALPETESAQWLEEVPGGGEK